MELRRGRRDGLRAALLAWGSAQRRDLPWRRTRDPWRVLVSEVMLQQTQVARVLGSYARFTASFPTPSACAAAGQAATVRAWEGLGYNRRAVSLHRAAVVIDAEHAGAVPSGREALLALPGIGAYTARAVRAFAFELDDGVVDTNVARVLARGVAGRALSGRDAQGLADDLVPPGDAWAWNQTLLDLGALVCTARDPACARCPVRSRCAWRRGAPREPDPALTSALTTRPQGRFDGSERQGRGRLVAALRRGPVRRDALAAAAGWPEDAARAARVADRLVAEGLARTDRAGTLVLA